MIKYNYFGIDFQFDAKDFPQEGEALINAIHEAAREKYDQTAKMIIDRNFDNYKKSQTFKTRFANIRRRKDGFRARRRLRSFGIARRPYRKSFGKNIASSLRPDSRTGRPARFI
jgi:hypothetical protein